MKRPLLMRSMSRAAMAVSKGLRAAAMAMPLARRMRSVAAAATASGRNGGPCTCAAKTPSRPWASACCAMAVMIGPGIGCTMPQ
jgi:hypothetical protein